MIILRGVKIISIFKIKKGFLKPLLFTIILIAVYRLGMQVSIPFLNAEAIENQWGPYAPYKKTEILFSIFMLGLMPYVTSYILVEFFSLFVPILKRIRSGGFKERLKLKRISLLLALPLAAYHANGLVSNLKQWTMPDGKSIINITSNMDHLILVGVMVGSFYLLVMLCELITRFGIGHGISIIILSGLCAGFISRIPVYMKGFESYNLSMYIIAVMVFSGFIYFAYVLLNTKISIPCFHEKDNKTVGYFQLNLAPSSIIALACTSTILVLPATISHLFDTGSTLANTLQPGSWLYHLTSIILIFTFSFLFGWAFFHPRKRLATMRKRGWNFADLNTTPERSLLKKLFIYNLPWTIFLCMTAIVPEILISSANLPFYIGGASMPVIVAISLDLIRGFKFYQSNLQLPIKIAEFHDVFDANMIHNHLIAAGVKSYLRGYHHRLLRYFFGPHLEISLIIDHRDQDKAKALIQDYYNGLGL